MTVLADEIAAGDRVALARGITLVESRAEPDQARGRELLGSLLPRTGGAVRVGITGVPGVGKSTLIETLGVRLLARGHRVAVLAIDPSSQLSGGSILGDKTRMAKLSREDGAFIRPSPTAGSLGGVARRTRETMLLCEAAGFDVVLIETVGVGQSEATASDMVDVFLLMLLPGGGDELQGIKRGILELADLLFVNKSDHDDRLAERTQRAYETAVSLMRPRHSGWTARALRGSALRGDAIDDLWTAVTAFTDMMRNSGQQEAQRRAQMLRWMWMLVDDAIMRSIRTHDAVAAVLPDLESRVRDGTLLPTAAAAEILDRFRGNGS